jgi:hypothetical protein
LKLPSNGSFWSEDSVDFPQNRELPVYPMTAVDEITYRTPDALFSGQSVINVIHSCVPNIKDHWSTPALDIDTLLIAIRIASYGHNMEIMSTCPACNTDSEYSLDLRTVLDKLKSGNFNQEIKHGDLSIAFRPMSYEHQNTSNQNQFEQQKRIQVVQTSDLTDAEKITELNNSLKTITELTMEALKWSIASIRTPHALVTESEHIHEFINNCDRSLFNTIKNHIIGLRENSEIQPIDMECPECHHKYRQQLTMDQTSFFADAS